MYFEDLSPYAYGLLGRVIERVLNVGWLEPEHAFPTGDAPDGFVHQLGRCAVTCRANQMRGFHTCAWCWELEGRFHLPAAQYASVDGRPVLLGSAEIWVPGADQKIFAAPTLIVHYVQEHRYLPPREFIESVLAVHDRRDWNAEKIADELTTSAFTER